MCTWVSNGGYQHRGNKPSIDGKTIPVSPGAGVKPVSDLQTS